MRGVGAATVVTIAFVVAVTGCGGDDDTGTVASTDATRHPHESTSTVPVAAIDPGSALLRLEDLPSDARAVAENVDALQLVRQGLFRQEVCDEVVGASVDLVAGRYSSFDAAATTPPLDVVNHGVLVLAGTEAADRQARFEQVAGACTAAWQTEGNGVTVEFEVDHSLDLPDLGFPAVGYELRYTEGAQPTQREWFVMMRSGGVLSSVIIVAPTDTDPATFEPILQAAAERLQAATGSG